MRTRWGAALVVAMASAAILHAAQPTLGELAETSARAEAARDYPAALAATRSIDRMLPGNPTVQGQLARQAALAGDRAAAIAALEALVRLGGGADTGKPHFASLADHPAARQAADNMRATGNVTPAFTLATSDTVVEGIAADPRSGALVMADMHRHRLIRRARDGREQVVPLPAGIDFALGLKADAKRGRLWQCAARRADGKARATLLLLDLRTLAPKREIAFPDDGAKHLCNDMDVLPDGRVAVTDSDGGRVWLADADGALAPLTPAGGFIYPNGVAAAADGRHVYVAHARGLARVAVTGGAVEPLASPDGQWLGGIDGLYRRGNGLIAVQNGISPMRIITVSLGRDGKPLATRALARAPDLFALPTTAAVHGGDLFVVANAQFRKIEDDGRLKPEQTLDPTRIVTVPLG